LVRTVKNFGGPKDPDAMLDAIRANKPLPMPIVIRKRDGSLFVAGGATRSGIALLAGQKITALVIDEKQANELMADRLEHMGEKEAKEEGWEKLYGDIKDYFLLDGPKPVIDKEDKFKAHLISYRYERIAKLRGINASDKHSKFNDFLITSDFKTTEKKFLDQKIPVEDIKEYLAIFKELRDRNKIKKADEKNIDFWGKKSWEDFKGFVDSLRTEKSKTEEKKIAKMEGAELLTENKLWSVYQMTTHKACQIYGSGTKWCITQDSDTDWKDYSQKNNIYFIISKIRPKEDPWYKIALLVDRKGEVTYWNALDEPYAELPKGFNFNIPKFKTEKAKKKELDEDLWNYGVRYTYHRYMEDLCRYISDHDISHQDAYFTKELAENAMRRFNAPSFTEACEKAIHYHDNKAKEYYAKIADKDLWHSIFEMFFESDVEKAWDKDEIGEEANSYTKLTPKILDRLDI
jgi:CRISPR/Cas system endoribonuclease Cas6 (RAMP superfamily)